MHLGNPYMTISNLSKKKAENSLSYRKSVASAGYIVYSIIIEAVMSNIDENSYIYLERLEPDINFHLINGKERNLIDSLRIGWDFLVSQFIHHDIPSEAEIEYAINYIEDELMKNPSLVNSDDLSLYCNDKVYQNLQGKKSGSIREFSKQDIEALFTRYALLSMGRSPVYDHVDMNAGEYMALLVIREILNHLGFESVRVMRE